MSYKNKSISLTDYVHQCMEYYDIPNDDNNLNFNKIRIKCTRILKESGEWDNAETKLIGRNKTRFFTSEQVSELSNELHSYLLKQSSLDIPKTSKFKPDEYMEKFTINKDISRNEKLMVMIEALFNEKFTLNTKLWELDKNMLHNHNSDNSAECIVAKERLSNPNKYYVKKKGN